MDLIDILSLTFYNIGNYSTLLVIFQAAIARPSNTSQNNLN